MDNEEFLTAELLRQIKLVATEVQCTFGRERDVHYSLELVEDSLKFCVANILDRVGEGMRHMFTSPNRPEFSDLERVLRSRACRSGASVIEESVQLALKFGEESIFNGHKSFSPKKFAAMIEYLSSQGHNIYKTNLNKLLFYSDLSYFYLRGVGISGAVYVHRRYGPVADPAAQTLNDLVLAKRVRIVRRTRTVELNSSSRTVNRALTKDERKVLDWVLGTYGNMTAAEISDLSHKEKAYRHTNPNQKIAYKYAPLLKFLPPRSLLD
jgi:uncharacterized phage-associated protein